MAPSSKFTLNITGSIATLYVGQERIKFQVHEETLCQLHFFRAALKGSFQEALEKSISMPEDDPALISALIVYLYSRTYTYATSAGSSGPKTEGESDHFDEGLFSIGVNTVATKYGCEGLADLALVTFEKLLLEKRSIDSLRILKAGYAKGWRYPENKSMSRVGCRVNLPGIICYLFKHHGEELGEALLEFPNLTCDLLRLSSEHNPHSQFWADLNSEPIPVVTHY